MTRDARLSALHRGGFGLPGPRFSHRHPLPLTLRRISDRIQRAPRSQVIVPGGRLPCLPRQRLQAAAAGRHASLRLQDVSGRRPSKSEAANLLLHPHFVVNRKMRIVAKKILGCSPSARRREIRGRRSPRLSRASPAGLTTQVGFIRLAHLMPRNWVNPISGGPSPFARSFLRRRWMAGSSPAMTDSDGSPD
jgi:hypothetical protein